jgi:hypothetical protein
MFPMHINASPLFQQISAQGQVWRQYLDFRAAAQREMARLRETPPPPLPKLNASHTGWIVDIIA